MVRIPKHAINWLVARLHVSTSDDAVKADIRKRCTAAQWTEAKIVEAEKYAVKSHRRNQALYQSVMMSGRNI
jgi:hypothetical protein